MLFIVIARKIHCEELVECDNVVKGYDVIVGDKSFRPPNRKVTQENMTAILMRHITMQHTLCLHHPERLAVFKNLVPPEVVIQLTVNYCYILISNKPSSMTAVKVAKAIA